MGTRADFYVGRGESAEWLGSIGWDGYPDGIPKAIFKVTDEDGYRKAVDKFFADREDVTYPKDGWPWPWDTSATTDFAYAFDDGRVHASCFGCAWFKPTSKAERPAGKTAVFPNMKDKQNLTLGPRSGLIVI